MKEEQASQSHQFHAYVPTKGEFTCPVCRRLGNGVLPILPSDVMPPVCNKLKVGIEEFSTLVWKTSTQMPYFLYFAILGDLSPRKHG